MITNVIISIETTKHFGNFYRLIFNNFQQEDDFLVHFRGRLALIRHLNQKWPNGKDSVRWYDLENEFLNYVKIGDKSDVLSKDEIEYVKKHGDYQLCNKLNYLGCDETFQSLYNKGYLNITDRIPRAATIPFREELASNSIQRDKKSFDLIHEGVASFITKAAEAGACTDRVAFAILFCASQFSETGEVAIHSFNYTPLPSPYDNSLEKNMFYVHGSCKQKKHRTRDKRV